MNSNRWNRRQVLKGLGASMALPLLPSLIPSLARAAVKPPKRVIFIMSYYAEVDALWFPKPPDINKMTKNADGTMSQSLSELVAMNGNKMSTSLGAKFNSFAPKMNIIQGSDIIGPANHNRSAFLTGQVSGDVTAPLNTPSIDSILEKSSAVYSAEPKRRALRLQGTLGGDGAQYISWSQDSLGKFVNPSFLTSDVAAYKYMFDGVTYGGGTPTSISPGTQSQVYAADRLLEAYKKLVNSKRLSSFDKSRVQEHYDRMASLEKQIGGGGALPTDPSSCKQITQTPYNTKNDPKELYSNFADIIVNSFACDLTRVVTLVIPHFEGAYDIRITGGLVAQHTNSHAIAYDTQGALLTEYLAYTNYISDRVAELLAKLEAAKEADGSSMLDNSLVVWGNEMGQGQHHRTQSLPLLCAGGLGGALKTGNFHDLRQRPFLSTRGQDPFYPFAGRPHSQFLSSVFRAMGVPPAEWATKGQNGVYGGWDTTSDFFTFMKKYENNRIDTLPYLVSA